MRIKPQPRTRDGLAIRHQVCEVGDRDGRLCRHALLLGLELLGIGIELCDLWVLTGSPRREQARGATGLGGQGCHACAGEARRQVTRERNAGARESAFAAKPATIAWQIAQVILNGRLVGGEGRQVVRRDLGVLNGLDQVVPRLVDGRLRHA